jgi:hypothetical protein
MSQGYDMFVRFRSVFLFRPGGLQAAAPNSSSNRLPILAISGAASSGSSSPDSQLSSGDRSPVMYPQVYNNDPFLSSHNIGSSASESEASPGKKIDN